MKTINLLQGAREKSLRQQSVPNIYLLQSRNRSPLFRPNLKKLLGGVWKIVEILMAFNLFLLIHEFGHFVGAAFLEIPVKRFVIGIGPKLAEFMLGNTIFTLNATPIFGYNEFQTSVIENLSWYQNLFLYSSGACFSFIIAWVGLKTCRREYKHLNRKSIFQHGMRLWFDLQYYFCLAPLFFLLAPYFPNLIKNLLNKLDLKQKQSSYTDLELSRPFKFWRFVVEMNFYNLTTIPGLDGGNIIYRSLAIAVLGFPIPFYISIIWLVGSFILSHPSLKKNLIDQKRLVNL